MPLVQIICLACSRKSEEIAGKNIKGHCVAGIDIATGNWVRPVSDLPSGTLTTQMCGLLPNVAHSSDTLLPTLLDIVEIGLCKRKANAAQPENWVIDNRKCRWVRTAGDVELKMLGNKLSYDPELFRNYDKEVTMLEVKERPPSESLLLVQPAQVNWLAELDYHGKRRMLGIFSISGQRYCLPLTDPMYAERLSELRLGKRVSAASIEGSSTEITLVLSLSDLFKLKGKHYKLIAGVLALPHSAISA